MIGFATQNHRKRSSKPMFLKNKVVFFAFQEPFFCLQSLNFSLEWKKILSKNFAIYFWIFLTKLLIIFTLGVQESKGVIARFARWGVKGHYLGKQSFIPHLSSFIVQRSSLNIQRSTFIAQRSSLIAHRSSFNDKKVPNLKIFPKNNYYFEIIVYLCILL